jgi:hypothetical protein
LVFAKALVICYSPTTYGKDGVLALHASAAGVRLYLHGAKSLPDPHKLLKGKGTKVRWLSIEKTADLSRGPVAEMVEGAIEIKVQRPLTRGYGNG